MPFYTGEVFPGKVIRQVDDHHSVVQLKGKPLLVECHVPLPDHWEGHLRVEATHPQVILKLVPKGEEEVLPAGSWFRKYLPQGPFLEDLPEKLSVLSQRESGPFPTPHRETIDHLLSLVNRLHFQHPFSPNSERLQELVVQSGLFFEHKLKHLIETRRGDRCDQMAMGDMKGLLVKLRGQLKAFSGMGHDSGKDPSNLNDMADALERIIQKIEGYQILNLLHTDSQKKIFLLLPICFQNNLQFAEINISLPNSESGRSESEETSILFLLDMPALGKMSIEVKINGKGLYCRFHVTRPEVSVFLDSALSGLKERFDRIGFNAQLNVSLETSEEVSRIFFDDTGSGPESLVNIIV